jgi:hypothetical protein
MPVMPRTLQALLTDLVDYAGLFPPARLDMGRAAEEYARAIRGEHAWMLGRFICPVTRLDEFEKAASVLMPGTNATSGYREHAGGPAGEPWRLSVLIDSLSGNVGGGPDAFERDLEAIHAFNDRHSQEDQGLAAIDLVEVKVSTPIQIDEALDVITDDLFPFFEFPVSAGGEGCDCRGFIAALSGSPAGAKIRTGGIVPGAFPTPREVASFLTYCAAAEIPFKATAGLHHPVRGAYRLTYEKDSASCRMHGFLNLFIAAALIKCGVQSGHADPTLAEQVLSEEDQDSFKVSDEIMGWREFLLDAAQIAHAREAFAHSFGSCSFDEPVEDLKKLGLA